jgi:DNA-binding GntR family transcriptional regulator
MPNAPLRSAQSLTEKVYRDLRASLLACRIAPGERLKIADLCEQLDVSLGAVREALSRLSSEGLVVTEPQRGFRAAPISREELQDLTQVRIEIESLCLRRALEVGDLSWESTAVAAFHTLAHTPKSGGDDPLMLSDIWSERHAHFHESLVSSCDSPTLMQIRRQLYAQSERYRRLSLPLAETDRDLVHEHRAMLDAVLARDADLAVALMAGHLRQTTQILLSAIALGSLNTVDA